VPQGASGGLLPHHGQVEVVPGKLFSDVRAQLLSDQVRGRLVGVHGPVRGADAPGDALQHCLVRQHVHELGPGEAGERGDAVVGEHLALVVADHDRDVRARLGQRDGQRLDGFLTALILPLPDLGRELFLNRRVSHGEQLIVRVVRGVPAEQPRIAPVALGVV